MAWGLSLNRPHVALWRRYLTGWAIFVAFVLVTGWSLSPRLDEVAFVLFLPLVILIPYVAVCLLGVYAKLWLLGLKRRAALWQARRIATMVANQRISPKT